MSAKRTLLILLLPPILLALAMVADAVGIEMNAVSVWVSQQYVGSGMIYVIPLNVSDPSLLTYSNTYVVSYPSNSPRLSYLFSSYPPMLVMIERHVGNAYYQVLYGGTNPYPDYVALPGSSSSPFFLFDEFDYDTGFWNIVNGTVEGGHINLRNGYISLTRGYSEPDVMYMASVLGTRAFRMDLNLTEPAGWFFISLTSREFTDWRRIADGSDIYFLDPQGRPLRYSILCLDKDAGRLDALVELSGVSTIFMVYGGANPYADYRVIP